MPCLNEEKYICTILKDLSWQTKKPDKVIIADAGSTDKTLKIIKKFKKLNIEVINGGWPATGRNNGAKLCPKNSLIYFMDADISIPKDFIKKTSEEFIKKNLDCAATKNKPFYRKWEKGYKNSFIRLMDNLIYTVTNQAIVIFSFLGLPLAIGTCMLAKKELVEKIKGFDVEKSPVEDVDFAQRAAKNGKFGVLKPLVRISTRRFDKNNRHFFLFQIFLRAVIFSKLGLSKKLKYFDPKFKKTS